LVGVSANSSERSLWAIRVLRASASLFNNSFARSGGGVANCLMTLVEVSSKRARVSTIGINSTSTRWWAKSGVCNIGVDTSSSGWIASIDSANFSVIARDWNLRADVCSRNSWNALRSVARIRSLASVSALLAVNIRNDLARLLSDVANSGEAFCWKVEVLCYVETISILSARSWASGGVWNIGVNASSSIWIARVHSAVKSVVASDWSVRALSGSISSDSASRNGFTLVTWLASALRNRALRRNNSGVLADSSRISRNTLSGITRSQRFAVEGSANGWCASLSFWWESDNIALFGDSVVLGSLAVAVELFSIGRSNTASITIANASSNELVGALSSGRVASVKGARDSIIARGCGVLASKSRVGGNAGCNITWSIWSASLLARALFGVSDCDWEARLCG
jgi:hypothetical protein